MKFKSIFLTLIFGLSLATTTTTKAEFDKSSTLAALAGAWYACVMVHHAKQARIKDKPVIKKIFHEATFWTMYVGALSFMVSNQNRFAREQVSAVVGFMAAVVISRAQDQN